MSREIKFRAWDVFNADMFPKKQNDDLLAAFFREVNERRNGGNTVHVMQFTGLEDMNGTEIYEGDILRLGEYRKPVPEDGDEGDGWYDDLICQVKYCAEHGYPAYDLFPDIGTDSNGLSYAIASQHVMVIGNVWQSPELVK